MGYHRAGFEVVGVDINPQLNYPFEFIKEDALALMRNLLVEPTEWIKTVDAIHASPPCQHYTKYGNTGRVGEYPDLVDETRELLEATCLPWVIENVEGSPLRNPIRICGSGLMNDLQRHRLFETNFPLMGVPCAHGRNAPDRFIGGRSKERTGSVRGLVRSTVEVGRWNQSFEDQKRAMGIDWMTLEELSEAIPPAYTEHIGGYLMAHLHAKAAA